MEVALIDWRLLISNGVVLAGVVWFAAVGAETQATMLLPPQGEAPETVGQLENQAALAPTAVAVAQLAGAYLDRDQPGLASAVIEKAPREVREQPTVAQLHARALFGRGRAREALAVAQQAHDRCDTPEGMACAPWLLAKTGQQVAFLEQVVAAGIEDPRADPDATFAAYERSSREVRLVAMR
jgi:hypothetical protein